MLKSIRRAAVTLSRNMSYVPKDRLSGKVAVVTASTDGLVGIIFLLLPNLIILHFVLELDML